MWFFVFLFFLFCFFLGGKGFFCVYEKYVFSPVPFLCMTFAEITFCSSINLEQPVMVLVLFFLTYRLSCGMRYLILSVPMSLLVLKENPGPHFAQRLFFLMNISLNIIYLVGICQYAMYSNCKCNVSKLLAPVVIWKKLMTVCMLPLAGRMRTLCNPRLQCLPYDR